MGGQPEDHIHGEGSYPRQNTVYFLYCTGRAANCQHCRNPRRIVARVCDRVPTPRLPGTQGFTPRSPKARNRGHPQCGSEHTPRPRPAARALIFRIRASVQIGIARSATDGFMNRLIWRLHRMPGAIQLCDQPVEDLIVVPANRNLRDFQAEAPGDHQIFYVEPETVQAAGAGKSPGRRGPRTA